MLILHMALSCSLLTGSGVIVNSSEETGVTVTLIKRDKTSHVKECRNSCSFVNFVGTE